MKVNHKILLECVTRSSEETMKLGGELAGKLKKGSLVTLTGELGSGKTTFVQGMFRKLGIKRFARSSSFIIANEYHSKHCKLYHLDLYRLSSGDINSLGLEEYLRGDGITLIEWADKLKKNSIKPSLAVDIKWISEQERRIRVS